MDNRFKDIDWAREIEVSIDEYYRDPDADGAEDRVILTILNAMKAAAIIMVPVELPEAAVRLFDPEKVKEGDIVTTDEDLHFKLINVTDNDGNVAMPVFTSQEKMEEAEMFCSTFDMPLSEYMKEVAEMDDVIGLVVDPFIRGFFIGMDLLRAMLAFYEENRMTQRITSDKSSLVKPDDVPDGFTETFKELVRSELVGIVRKVWFAGLDDDGSKSWLIAVDTDAEEPKEVFNRIQDFLIHKKLTGPVDYMVVHDGFWSGAELIYDGGAEPSGGEMLS